MSDRYQQAKRVTLIGAIINALLGVIKLIGGIVYHSHALTADGIHSFSDLITDVMVIFASKFGSQHADSSHPYGHQRIETAATLLLALLLALTGFGIAWDAIDEIIQGFHNIPAKITLFIALFSVFLNEILFHYTRFIGQQIQSSLIIANAWHHRSDAAASLIVTIGIIGSFMGFPYLDAVAAIVVGLMIIKMGLNYGWSSVKELVDTAIEPELLEEIRKIIQQVDGVQRIHQLRSRSMGENILIDVHVLVSPFISVSEGHFIAQHVHHLLMKQFKRINDVMVHVDPEDDEVNCPSLHLPSRKTLENTLLNLCKQQFPRIQDWTLHYLDGKMRIDLIHHYSHEQLNELTGFLKAQLPKYPFIMQIYLFYDDKFIANS
ncbi:cation efflux family protein [Legionella beliardensis]|uniref:Cation efflux family protein n=1 Tax=Legionella beliardensis TaxID=91822 RepID=A0A378HYV9_9GAMM|nr:cation diffusion facilitator family transporter [Legionella beliardensis]STX28089.1 cation efflux family protein [Legionella beliardensis]